MVGWDPSVSDLIIPGHHPATALDGRYPEALSGKMPSVLILLGKWLLKENSTEVMLAFLGSTRVGCISARRAPPEEVEGADFGDEGEESEPGPLVVTARHSVMTNALCAAPPRPPRPPRPARSPRPPESISVDAPMVGRCA